MNASIQKAILIYCESCKKEDRRPSCFGCVFDKRLDDLGDAVVAVGREMDAQRTPWERIVDAARSAELHAELIWRRLVRA